MTVACLQGLEQGFFLGFDCGLLLGQVWLKSEGLERILSRALFLEGLVLGKVAPQFQDFSF